VVLSEAMAWGSVVRDRIGRPCRHRGGDRYSAEHARGVVSFTAPFAFGTYLFDRDRLLAQLEPTEPARNAFYKAADQYAWHAVDVLPFIKATETLNWTEPSRHWTEPTDAGAGADGRGARSQGGAVRQTSSVGYSETTGVLLVIYKILVLAPLLAAGRLAWVAARARRDGTDTIAARAESSPAKR
jgi:hypothetical protein